MNKQISIDIGTSSVLIYVKGKGIVLQEPSVITVDNITNRVIKIGREAREMTGRTPESVVNVYPVCDGVINRYTHAAVMLKKFLSRSCGTFVVRPDITLCVPCGISDVEEMAFKSLADEIGAKNVYMIDSPLAFAIGEGIDVLAPEGNMIIDIGGGNTNISVISLGGTVVDNCVKCGGNKFNESLIKYVRSKYELAISEEAAEEAKIKAGTVWPSGNTATVTVKGRNVRNYRPESVMLGATDMVNAFEDPMTRIGEAICTVIESTPPELVSDIAKKGIIMAGGGSLINGIDRLVSSITGMPVRIAEKPLSGAVLGAGRASDLDIDPHSPRKRI